jgi:hypothetical protein
MARDTAMNQRGGNEHGQDTKNLQRRGSFLPIRGFSAEEDQDQGSQAQASRVEKETPDRGQELARAAIRELVADGL